MLNAKAKRLLRLLGGATFIRKPALLAALLTLGLTPAAHAVVIQNGSFESGLTGWTIGAGINVDAPRLISNGTRTAALIGINSFFGSAVGTFSQNFTLADDGMFDYSFLAARSEGACGCNDVPLTFAIRIDDIILSNVLPIFDPAGGVHPFHITQLSSYTGSLLLSAGTHILAFDFSRGETLFGRGPYFVLTSVDVTPQAVVAPPPTSTDVPEPITLSLLGAGLAGVALMRRRLV